MDENTGLGKESIGIETQLQVQSHEPGIYTVYADSGERGSVTEVQRESSGEMRSWNRPGPDQVDLCRWKHRV